MGAQDQDEDRHKCANFVVDDHAEDNVAEEIETEDEEIEDPGAPKEAPARSKRNHIDPTPEERAKHDTTRLPFRPWCPICAEAKAVEDIHHRQTEEEREQGNPQICADYCEIGDDEKDKNDKKFCFVARVKWSKTMHADLADVKGDSDAQIAKGFKQFITSM